jgi:hypothetical protein
MNGYFQIFVYGEWGVVIDDFNQRNVSNIVCRQLGYERAAVTDDPYPFKQCHLAGAIVWLFVQCQGNESSIFDCPSNGIGLKDGHINDDYICTTCLGECTALS